MEISFEIKEPAVLLSCLLVDYSKRLRQISGMRRTEKGMLSVRNPGQQPGPDFIIVFDPRAELDSTETFTNEPGR